MSKSGPGIFRAPLVIYSEQSKNHFQEIAQLIPKAVFRIGQMNHPSSTFIYWLLGEIRFISNPKNKPII